MTPGPVPRSNPPGADLDLASQRHLVGVLEDLVAARTRVQMIGTTAVGKTTVLAQLEARLRDRDFSVLTVRGVHGLRRHPLAALMLATSAAFDPAQLRNRGRMPATVSGVAAVLRSVLGPGPGAVLVDDADELDGTTAGLIDSVCRERGTPVVLTRAPISPDEIDVATEQLAADATSLTIPPLELSEADHLLRQRLGAPVAPSTTSRIHTLSGGAVGLILALAADAAREGRLRSSRGVWTAEADVWSPALSAHAMRHIGRLREDERRALELISLASPCRLATAMSLAPRNALSSLAARGLLKAVAAGGEQYTAVHPPLLAEHFRRTAGSLRARLLVAAPQDDEPGLAGASAPLGEDPDDGGVHQLMRDRAGAERRAARESWIRDPGPATAVAYLRTIESDPATEGLAWDVFAQTSPKGDPLDRVALQVAEARWSTMTTVDPAGASDLDHAVAESSAGARAMAIAGRTMIDAAFRTVERVTAPAAPADELQPRARAAVTDAEVLALVARARFDEAVTAFEVSQRDPQIRMLVSDTSRALYGVALLGQGRAKDAAAWLDARLRSARDALDPDATRVHALARMFTHLLDGELHLAHRCAEAVHEVGEPSRILRGQRLAFLTMSGVLAARQGDRDLAELNAELLAELRPPDGPLPTQSPAWLDAQLAASAGDSSTAATMLWDAAESLWKRGACFSAALGMLVAAETTLDERMLAEAAARVRPLGSPLLDAQLAYVSATVSRSADGLSESVPALVRTGRRALALEALRAASALLRARGDAEGADARRAQLAEIARSFGSRAPDTVRYNAARHSLSDRELEVARLAARGLANSEIADHLGVSVRTVESHIYRCLRKLGLSGRQELREYLSTEVPLR